MLDRGPVLATIYIYGHLVAATFSLAMALAFAVSALRVPGARNDWWTTVLFVLTASTGTVEMLLAMTPSLELARALIALEGILIFFVGVGFHAQFAAEVLSPRALARHRLAVFGCAGWCCLLVTLIIGGVLDDGMARPIAVAGIHSTAMALRTPGFIISLAYAARTRTGVMKGKLSYMAPEQVQTSTYDQRIDVYALGVVLFEMLANRLPYAGSSEPTVLRRLMERTIPSRGAAPPGCRRRSAPSCARRRARTPPNAHRRPQSCVTRSSRCAMKRARAPS